MISFSTMRSRNTEDGTPYERMSEMLLQAIGLHAVEAEPAEHDRFRAAVTGLQAKLGQDSSPANILVVTGAVVQALQHYNQRVSSSFQAQSTELQRMVDMLTQAMAEISAGRAASISQLHELQKSIEEAGAIDDMRVLRARLSDCLESIRKETKRQRDESTRVVTQLDQKLQAGLPAKPATPEGIDPVTGLGLRFEAEKAIEAACNDAHAYAALFLVDRIQVINTRFGTALGNKLLLFFSQHLFQGLSPTDQVFRWSRGAFLAVMEREETYEPVRRELARLFSRRLEQTFEMGDRSVVIPVASTWAVFPLAGCGPREIGRKLDTFIAASPGQAAD